MAKESYHDGQGPGPEDPTRKDETRDAQALLGQKVLRRGL